MNRAKLVVGMAITASVLAYAGCGDDDIAQNPASNDAGPDLGCVTCVDAAAPLDAGSDASFDASDSAPPDPCASDKDGGLYDHLSCTGLYSTESVTSPVSSIVSAYAPGTPAFDDGATIARYISIPAGQKINTTDMDNWVFPVGTKAWQELSVGGVKVETRFFQKTGAQVWLGTSYVWNAGQTDAIRNDNGVAATALDAGGYSYEIPASAVCIACHEGASDNLIGFEAVGLGLSSATGLTLSQLKTSALLTSPPATTTVTLPNDGTTVAPAALAWMHGNCGNACHNDRANADGMFTGMYLRIRASDVLGDAGTPVNMLDTYTTAVGVGMSVDDAGPGVTYRIQSGSAAQSGVIVMATRRDFPSDTYQMPPLLLHQVDEAGVGAVSAWINAGP